MGDDVIGVTPPVTAESFDVSGVTPSVISGSVDVSGVTPPDTVGKFSTSVRDSTSDRGECWRQWCT